MVPTLKTTLSPTTVPTPLPQATSTTQTQPTSSQSLSSTRSSLINSTLPVFCVKCPSTSFPLGLGIGIVVGLISGLILSGVIIGVYCFVKRKKTKDGQIVSYNGGYLTPTVSSSLPSNQPQGQSSDEVNQYEALGDTLPKPTSHYEPLKIYENNSKSRK